VSNRVTLAQLAEMPKEDVVKLPLPHVAMLLEDVAELAAKAKASAKILNDALLFRFADEAARLRRAEGKDTGTVTITADGFKVKVDLPKKVDWNQMALRHSIAQLVAAGENPADYVATELKVAESKYTAWPPSLKRIFEPARTLGVGAPTIKLEPMKEAA
jgi:hypothetical protein